MAKDTGNKGIILFWVGVLAVIAIVLLIIFIPRTNPNAPKENMEKIIAKTAITDNYYRTYADFVDKLANDEKLDGNLKIKIDCVTAIVNTTQKLNTFNSTAFLNISTSGSFNSLCKQHTSSANALEDEIESFQSYCFNTVNDFFKTEYLSNDLKNVASVFVGKYINLAEKYVDYYLLTANFIEECSDRGMDITDDKVQCNIDIMTEAQGYVENMKNNIYNQQKINDLLNKANQNF